MGRTSAPVRRTESFLNLRFSIFPNEDATFNFGTVGDGDRASWERPAGGTFRDA